MSVRILLVAAALVTVAPAASARPSAGDPPTAVATSEPQAEPRRPGRAKPVPPPPVRRRTMEAPGAVLMLIPASYTPQR